MSQDLDALLVPGHAIALGDLRQRGFTSMRNQPGAFVLTFLRRLPDPCWTW